MKEPNSDVCNVENCHHIMIIYQTEASLSGVVFVQELNTKSGFSCEEA